MAGLAGLMKLYEQQNKKDAPKTEEAPKQEEKKDTAATTGTEENKDVKISRQPSKTLSDSRKQKSKEHGVFGFGGGKKKGKQVNESCILRVMNDLQNIDVEATPGVTLHVEEKSDFRTFKVDVEPQEGLWAKAKYNFIIKIPADYPYQPPEVTCDTLVYHPNIDLKGRVCLNILRFEWSAALGLGHVLFGLMTLFLEPNPDDPLNIEAADLMVKNNEQFKKNVYDSLRGKYVAGHQFPKLL
eukprot:TRINITY_DN10424_c0_g1_i1.p1 TRINITY_DN10424_c0_g1~~TRINITY_DN10424_c0_g1_i1.p1  ORF type:complete len:241 (+),score=71.80 TRINITY_DN10424_c0_g1_i1:49-771(+)